MRMGGWELDSDDCVLAAAARDPSASAAFYRRYERSMLAFFVRRTGDPELAGDPTAEVFAAALDSCAPDGVTTVTLYYGARDSGSTARGDEHDRRGERRWNGRERVSGRGARDRQRMDPPAPRTAAAWTAFPDKIVWRSASGAVIKTHPGAPERADTLGVVRLGCSLRLRPGFRCRSRERGRAGPRIERRQPADRPATPDGIQAPRASLPVARAGTSPSTVAVALPVGETLSPVQIAGLFAVSVRRTVFTLAAGRSRTRSRRALGFVPF